LPAGVPARAARGKRSISISRTFLRVARLAAPLVFIGASVMLISAPPPAFMSRDKAYYANAAVVNFVRPGLVLKIGCRRCPRELAAFGSVC
jgi:hypothetical protein